MRSFLQEYFYYSRAERNGAFVLALLCAALFLVPRLYPYFAQEAGAEYAQYQEEALAFFEALPAAGSSPEQPAGQLFYFDPNTISKDSLLLLGLPDRTAGTIIRYREKVRPFYRREDLRKIYTLTDDDYQRLEPYIRLAPPPAPARQVKMQWEENRETTPRLQPFPFDPNTATPEELNRLGLPEQLVRNIVKYREKGGRFRQPEALRKIYGMEERWYSVLEPFIEIRAEGSSAPEAALIKHGPSRPAPSDTPPATIDINKANEEEWQQLRGIGPGYARRIVRFREKLGGFASIGQVGETFGLPDSTFHQIYPQLQLSPPFRLLNINAADAETLKAHPYLDWRMANAIVNYRANHGRFDNIEALRKVRALPGEVVEKLAPYVSYE